MHGHGRDRWRHHRPRLGVLSRPSGRIGDAPRVRLARHGQHGLLGGWHPPAVHHPVNVHLSGRSIEVWSTFEETFGVDIAYRRPGYLYLARSPSTVEQFEETVALQHELGVETQLLSPAEAVEVCPELHTDRFLAATYRPTDGFADPNLAVQGFATGAREAVDIGTNTPVRDLVFTDDRGVGVETEAEVITADTVVDTAGGWLSRVAAMAGIDLPVSPRRRQVLVVDPERPVAASVPLTIDLDTGLYFRPERDGRALVGGHLSGKDPEADSDRFRTTFDMPWAIDALEHAADVAGYFGPETRVLDGWAGLYVVTPDRHPIIDEVAPGLVVAGGFSGHCFQHAPATGMIVAELVLEGEVTLVDHAPLSFDRFAHRDPEVEQNVV